MQNVNNNIKINLDKKIEQKMLPNICTMQNQFFIVSFYIEVTNKIHVKQECIKY